MNANEQRFFDILTAKGYQPRPQVAMGTGSVDFLIPSLAVAVEVGLRGTTCRYVASGYLERRIRDCANRGWHCYIFIGQNADSICEDAMQDIFAWLKFIGGSPASRRQYRMVWGATELLAAGCSDDEHIAIISPGEYLSKIADRKGEG